MMNACFGSFSFSPTRTIVAAWSICTWLRPPTGVGFFTTALVFVTFGFGLGEAGALGLTDGSGGVETLGVGATR
ncbi:hypothetical protein Raf01_93940 [Rugosimonospora africana]|uniref:Uncharacterized protein n=1 Tax=Rugosimonospora africana TaxID=556532 RepID=A0A8J3VVZ9_9ACTN|nr:hypothetical protein Raf01_93940 [Rugosimonospora africana]